MKLGLRGGALALGMATVLALGAAGFAAAQAPADTIKSRIGKMKEIGGHMKKNTDAVKEGKIVPAEVAQNAAAIETLSKNIVAWFPPGTGPGAGAETRAMPAIWEKNADFQKAAGDLTAAAAALAAAAKTGDAKAIEAAHGDVGKACGGCHRPFRAEKAS